MARGKKSGGRDFVPGVSGNPDGRPPVQSDVLAVRRLTNADVVRIANELLEKSKAELTAILKDPRTPAKVGILARLVRTSLWSADHRRSWFLLDRIAAANEAAAAGGSLAAPEAGAEPREKTFEQFCEAAGYPAPFPKQVEMMRFGMEETVPRLVLGAPGYGKTDYVVIAGCAYDIYRNWRKGAHTDKQTASTTLLMTKSADRNKAVLSEVAEALSKNGVPIEVNNATEVRVAGLAGKEASLSSVTIKAVSLRGRHPRRAIMEDVVTEDDTSESTRALVDKKYSELMKRTQNVLVVGQPVHKHDLYETLRPILKKLEVPHGSIPELDHDLEAMRLAGVTPASISASYHLKVLSEGTTPFGAVKYLERFPPGDSVAFIDPSFEGGDYTAISIVKAHFNGVAVQGHVWKQAWNHCLEEMALRMKECGVRRLCFETNSLGDQPILLLRQVLKDTGIGVVGKKSTTHKHSRIMAAGAFAHLIHLSKTSDRLYLEHVVKYEYKAKFDDAPDSLASCMEWVGLIRGKVKA